MAVLERDYKNMDALIFGEPPPFEDIMETFGGLGTEVDKR
jgi:hypothetical protein